MSTYKITDGGVVYLSEGVAQNGQDYWAYLMVPFERVEEYERASHARESFDLKDYGTILRWDYGKSPPDALKAEIEANLPLRHDFVERAHEELLKTPTGRRILEDAKKQLESTQKPVA